MADLEDTIGRALHGRVDWNLASGPAGSASVSVAPFTGAWIETGWRPAEAGPNFRRALHGRVDWNLYRGYNRRVLSQSRPSRARGLKHFLSDFLNICPLASRPSRARGLKRPILTPITIGAQGRALHGRVDWNTIGNIVQDMVLESRPSRARGLKHRMRRTSPIKRPVAPFTGAWIETAYGRGLTAKTDVAPFTGAWIETKGRNYPVGHISSRALHGRVDWNSI